MDESNCTCNVDVCRQCGEGRFWHCSICHGCEYCCMDDERTTEKVFRKMREWLASHPVSRYARATSSSGGERDNDRGAEAGN